MNTSEQRSVSYGNIARGCLLFLLMGCFLAGTNCVKREFGDPKVEGSQTLNPRQLQDIPTPDDAVFEKEASYSYVLPGSEARVARVVYRTDHSPDFLEDYYKDKMGLFGWKESEHNISGKGTLQFYSENESCTINITESESRRTKRRGKKPTKIKIEINAREYAG